MFLHIAILASPLAALRRSKSAGRFGRVRDLLATLGKLGERWRFLKIGGIALSNRDFNAVSETCQEKSQQQEGIVRNGQTA